MRLVMVFALLMGELPFRPALAADVAPSVRLAGPDLRASIEARLTADLHQVRPSWTIRRCSVVLSYTPPMPSGHDWSWGAACRVSIDGKQQMRWFCDDWLVGKFKSEAVGDAAHLGRFVATSCPPGG